VVAQFDNEPNEEYVTVQNFRIREDPEVHLSRVRGYDPVKSDSVDPEK
jgi:hypothetical protein